MTPADYASTVVLPTIGEFFATRGDRRLAYLSCIATYHLADHISHANGMSQRQIFSTMLDSCKSDWRVVHGLCNGTKHPNHQGITPGLERDVPAVAFGVGFYGVGRWGGIPGLEVEVGDGRWAIVDDSLKAVLRAFVRQFPAELAGVDLSPLDIPYG